MNTAIICTLDRCAQDKNTWTLNMDDKCKDLISYIDYCIVTKGEFDTFSGYSLTIKDLSDYHANELTKLYCLCMIKDFTACLFDANGNVHADLQKKFLYLLDNPYSKDFSDCLIGHANDYCQNTLQNLINKRCVDLYPDASKRMSA
jgi:hypothetical protein